MNCLFLNDVISTCICTTYGQATISVMALIPNHSIISYGSAAMCNLPPTFTGAHVWLVSVQWAHVP